MCPGCSGQDIVVDDDTDGTQGDGADAAVTRAGYVEEEVFILFGRGVADDFHWQCHMVFTGVEHQSAAAGQVVFTAFGRAVTGGIGDAQRLAGVGAAKRQRYPEITQAQAAVALNDMALYLVGTGRCTGLVSAQGLVDDLLVGVPAEFGKNRTLRFSGQS